ncbi:MAG: hypothetical protein KY053_02130 [Candidatus Liptonbacteria bacterium]|nr:hypothetical protein [Candidatus Liptonbacteria bacterium]
MKKLHLLILGIVVFGGLILLTVYYLPVKTDTELEVRQELQCEIGEMTYYYRPECSWCQRIDREDTIDKIEELGVDVRKAYSRAGSVPRFLIDNETYVGYRTFEQLKELLGCLKTK